MIISCPSCSARYNFPEERLSNDSMAISCAACGHSWVESRAIEIVDVSPRKVPGVIEHGFEPDSEVKRLVEASRLAREAFAVKRQQKLGRLRGWAILGACVLAPVAAAASFPEAVVAIAPVTVRAYDAMGYSVNIYGLEVRRIEQQYAIVDGMRVLSIKGEINNVSNSTQKIPWLRFGLKDGQQLEVYNWTLDTGARPLRAGESTSFVTRVASPPETAKNLQIRFAHRDEIGSNPSP
jgi:predicted Zn finger-like uncharacterized protein